MKASRARPVAKRARVEGSGAVVTTQSPGEFVFAASVRIAGNLGHPATMHSMRSVINWILVKMSAVCKSRKGTELKSRNRRFHRRGSANVLVDIENCWISVGVTSETETGPEENEKLVTAEEISPNANDLQSPLPPVNPQSMVKDPVTLSLVVKGAKAVVKLFPMYVYVSESALAVPAMPIMASPTNAPISFLYIAASP